jgi:hypothetical protein
MESQKDYVFTGIFSISVIFEGYNQENGAFMSKLIISEVYLEDFGRYECLSLESKQVIKSFQLYVKSNASLLYPIDVIDRYINVNSGGSVTIPCRLTDPTDPEAEISLINQNTNNEVANVVHINPDAGFLIQNLRLPDHDGTFICKAKSGNNREDSIHFRLILALNPNSGIGTNTPLITDANDISKPYITTINGSDVHAGDNIALKCMLLVRNGIANRVELQWLVLAINNPLLPDQLVMEEQDELNPGYTKFIATNAIPNIQTPGPFRCTAKFKDEIGNTVEARSEQIKLNIIHFKDDFMTSKTIEWHRDAFNPEIHVKDGNVKWIIGFTLHRKDRGPIMNNPIYDFIKVDKVKTMITGSKFDTHIDPEMDYNNRFTVTLNLYNVDPSDMGEYQLRVYDDDDGSSFEPISMFLYVMTKPKVSFQVENPIGFYREGQWHRALCNILSYPMNETRYIHQ